MVDDHGLRKAVVINPFAPAPIAADRDVQQQMHIPIEGPAGIAIAFLAKGKARRIIDRCRTELAAEGHAMAENIPVGAMIEVPAAAIAAPWLARTCDFFSIGTNDLIQYTLAIDRVDDEVNYLYDPLHPAVLTLVRQTIAAGEEAGIPVGMCGEMAGDARFTRLLLGLGLTEFSMHPSSMLEVKRIIIEADIAALRTRVTRALAATDLADQRSRLAELEAQ